jgi:hypothetical protein
MDLKKHERKGQGLVEYSLIMVLVVLVGMIGLFFFGPAVKSTYAQVVCEMEGVSGDPGCYYFLRDGSSLGGGQAVVTWKQAPGALRYDVKTRTAGCHNTGVCPSAPRGGVYEASEVCNVGVCTVSFASNAGRYVTIIAYGAKGTRTEYGIIP